MPNIHEIRERCRYARQFHYPEYLFNRMPTYVFQYFGSPNPLDSIPGLFDQMDIMNIFMLINGISAELMMAFYAAGEQEVDTVIRIHEYFLRMYSLYNESSVNDLIANFGSYFSYHLETRSLRRIDMSVVNYNRHQRLSNNFVPNQVNWRRALEIRQLYRRGQYQIMDEYDLLEFRMAWFGGLRIRRGRFNRN